MITKGNLIAARIAKGMTQAELAAKAGVPQSTISELENGKRETTDALPEIATVLDMEPGDLDPRYAIERFFPARLVACLRAAREAPPDVQSELAGYIMGRLSGLSQQPQDGRLALPSGQAGIPRNPHTLEGELAIVDQRTSQALKERQTPSGSSSKQPLRGAVRKSGGSVAHRTRESKT